MSIFTQNPAFARGEIAPQLHPRADLAWHRLALKAMRNRFTAETGGAPRRPGTVFIDERRYPNKKSVGIPFTFSSVTGDTYILEFGDLYMEVVRGGVRITEAAKAVSAVALSNPCALTVVGHGMVPGDDFHTLTIPGTTQLSGRRLRVLAAPDADTIWLADLDGVGIDATGYSAYAGPGGQVARVYKIPTPYAEAHLERLYYAQSFDVMTLTHPSYPTQELSRTGHTAWTLAPATFAPKTKAPGDLNYNTATPATAGAVGTGVFKYQATAIDATTKEESLAGYEQRRNVIAVSAANPCVITTSASHGYQTGDQVRLKDMEEIPQLDGKTFVVTYIGAGSFSLDGVDSTSYPALASPATAQRPYYRIDLCADPTSPLPNKITIPLVPNCQRYPVYRERNGVFGYIGTYDLGKVPELTLGGLPTPASVVFSDVGVETDPDDAPPQQKNPFEGVGNYPAVVAFHQQRRLFGGSDLAPGTIHASAEGKFSNFTVHEPIRDSDALEMPLASGEHNPIRHILSVRRALVLAGANESALEGDDAGTLTPRAINARPYSYEGSSFLRPIKVGAVVLYVQARGWMVRDLGYDFGADSYKGQNRSLPSRHLLEGYTLVDWAYQKVPHSIIWSVRDDGMLLGLTYIPDQEMFAWHRHDTDGAFERVVSVPEGDGGDAFLTKTPSGKVEGRIDGVYLFTSRTVDGKTRRYIERFDRGVVDALDLTAHKYLDASLSYDGWHKGSDSLVLSGGVAWTPEETLTLTSPSPLFSAADTDVDGAGDPLVEYFLKDAASGELVRCRPTAYTSPTEISVRADHDVPVSVRNTTTWAKAIRRVSGLWHLEAKAVAVLADGFVVASPYNPAYAAVTVSQGATVLPGSPRAVIHVGLPYVSDLETLNPEIPEGQSLAGKSKRVSNVGLHLHEAAGAIWVGRRPENDDGKTLTNLRELKDGENGENPEIPPPLRTEFIDVPIAADWKSDASVLARVVDPVPGEILGTVLSMAAR